MKPKYELLVAMPLVGAVKRSGACTMGSALVGLNTASSPSPSYLSGTDI